MGTFKLNINWSCWRGKRRCRVRKRTFKLFFAIILTLVNINIAWKGSHYPDLMQSLFSTHLFFLKETKKWHTFLLWLCNSKYVVSVFYYACACIYSCKTFDTIIFVFQNMAKANVQRQKEWRERQNNLEEFQKKELDRLNAYNRKQNKTEFHAKHRDATHRWREGKRINNDNQTNIPHQNFQNQQKSCLARV